MTAKTRLDRLLANRGYGSRSEAAKLIRSGSVRAGGRLIRDPAFKALPEEVQIAGEDLRPGPGVIILLHKPRGYACSRRENCPLVYDLLPPEYRRRRPPLSCVGRLDKDSSGLLLMTDDGELLHRLISPRSRVKKVYEVLLAEDLKGNEAEFFASGKVLLRNEKKPLLPAGLEVMGERRARITLTEGRYHQVKRMFAAAGNRVLELKRIEFAGIELGDLKPGETRILPAETAAKFS